MPLVDESERIRQPPATVVIEKRQDSGEIIVVLRLSGLGLEEEDDLWLCGFP